MHFNELLYTINESKLDGIIKRPVIVRSFFAFNFWKTLSIMSFMSRNSKKHRHNWLKFTQQNSRQNCTSFFMKELQLG